MEIDAELDVWRREWQSSTAGSLELRKVVERQSRFMKIALLADVLVTVVIGGGTIAGAVMWPEPDMVLLAGFTWLFIAVAWVVSLRINRGNWSPSAVDTAAFVELSIRRCRARIAALRFGVGLFVVQMALCLGWIYNHSFNGEPVLRWLFFSSVSIDGAWVAAVVFFGFVVWYRRKKRAELVWLLTLREQVRED